jgi:hypothetical protein
MTWPCSQSTQNLTCQVWIPGQPFGRPTGRLAPGAVERAARDFGAVVLGVRGAGAAPLIGRVRGLPTGRFAGAAAATGADAFAADALEAAAFGAGADAIAARIDRSVASSRTASASTRR